MLKLNDSPSQIKKPSKSDFKSQLSKIESGIHAKEKELRQNLIDAYDLQEENYPNSNILIQGQEHFLTTTFLICFNFNILLFKKIDKGGTDHHRPPGHHKQHILDRSQSAGLTAAVADRQIERVDADAQLRTLGPLQIERQLLRVELDTDAQQLRVAVVAGQQLVSLR